MFCRTDIEDCGPPLPLNNPSIKKSAMGIKGFGKWLRGRYPSAFIPKSQFCQNIDEVYVEMNSLLHCTSRSVSTESHLQALVLRHLKDINRRYRPLCKLFLALDGPASLLKLAEQRKRRLDNGITAERTGLFDAQQFTPGCTFMWRFEQFLTDNASQMVESHRGLSTFHYIVSGASTLGEGETKIFNEIASSNHRTSSSARKNARVIVTTDSDTMLHAIGHSIPHTYIVTPPWDHARSDAIFDVDRLLHLLLQESQRDLKQTVHDFAFIVSLSGNDYLPSIQFGNYSTLWPHYCSLSGLQLIDLKTGSLNYDQFLSLLSSFMNSKAFDLHHGLQNAILDKARSIPKETVERIRNFLVGVLAVTRQCTGTSNKVTISFNFSDTCAPSVGEFVEFFLDDSVSSLMEETATLSLIPQSPATLAIMLLEPNTRNLKYFPPPIRNLVLEYNGRANEFATDRDAKEWLDQQLAAMNKSKLPQEDLGCLLQRPSIIKIFSPHRPKTPQRPGIGRPHS